MEGYYTSGEFAKKANVSIRTIRCYDKQGLLKPAGDNPVTDWKKILRLIYITNMEKKHGRTV